MFSPDSAKLPRASKATAVGHFFKSEVLAFGEIPSGFEA
jgi:hypothetical protein